MDPSVKAALARWPDVPAAFGWLSLDARGHWHLHADGTAAQGGAGEPITNPQIVAFIHRNYDHDDAGRWFFQNGPQRAYVRLDAAPYILRRADTGDGLVTHTGQPVSAVRRWCLVDGETLFAETDLGPGIVEDRELAPVLDALRTPQGVSLADWLAADDARTEPLPATLALAGLGEAPLFEAARTHVASELGFDANPTGA